MRQECAAKQDRVESGEGLKADGSVEYGPFAEVGLGSPSSSLASPSLCTIPDTGPAPHVGEREGLCFVVWGR